MTAAEAKAEIAADFTELIFADENTLRTFAEANFKTLDGRNLLQRLADAIRRIIASLKKTKVSIDAEAARKLKLDGVIDRLEQAEMLLRDALKEGGHQRSGVSGDGKVMYSFLGKNKSGIEVYETSKNTLSLSWKDRKERFLDVMSNEYAGRTAKFVRNGHAYYATFDKVDVKKNIYGDTKSDDKCRDAKINAGADGDIFELVENAQYDGSKPEKGKKNKAHNGVGYLDYFIKKVQIDGTVFDLVANVRKKASGEFVYSLQLNEDKNTKAAPPETLRNASEFNGAQTASAINIPQPDTSVNSQQSTIGASLRDLAKQYREIAPGENPAREVHLPKKTSKRKNVSLTARTILESGVTPGTVLPDVERLIKSGAFSWEVYSYEVKYPKTAFRRRLFYIFYGISYTSLCSYSSSRVISSSSFSSKSSPNLT
ncbi:MAG: hypothetical protein IJE90_09435 [Clostridia bacterium]|nr:hypothetical protein [Clostridia bacterium]